MFSDQYPGRITDTRPSVLVTANISNVKHLTSYTLVLYKHAIYACVCHLYIHLNIYGYVHLCLHMQDTQIHKCRPNNRAKILILPRIFMVAEKTYKTLFGDFFEEYHSIKPSRI